MELPTRKQLPHSVFTFLSLVEAQFYDATTLVLVPGQSQILQTQATSPDATTKKLKTLGLGGAPESSSTALSFEEYSSSYPCDAFSIAFHGLGPTMEILLSSEFSNEEKGCFGQLVRGQKTMAKAHKAISSGGQVTITEARLLVLGQL